MSGTIRTVTINKDLCAAKRFVQVSEQKLRHSYRLFFTLSDIGSLIQEEGGCQREECTRNCSSGWEERDGHCYLFSQERLFWGEAEERCRHLGGHLASITSQEEHDYLQYNVSESYEEFPNSSKLSQTVM